jgi:hypothetical protein
MSPLQRDVTAAFFSGDDRWEDEALAERYGTTPGAIRIERGQARRLLQEALASDSGLPRR